MIRYIEGCGKRVHWLQHETETCMDPKVSGEGTQVVEAVRGQKA